MSSYSEEEFQQLIHKSVKTAITSLNGEVGRGINATSELMDVKDAAKYLKVSKLTIHNWKKLGLLPYKKINRRIYFAKDDIIKHMYTPRNFGGKS